MTIPQPVAAAAAGIPSSHSHHHDDQPPVRYVPVYGASAPPSPTPTTWFSYLTYILALIGLLTLVLRVLGAKARSKSSRKGKRRKSVSSGTSKAKSGGVKSAAGKAGGITRSDGTVVNGDGVVRSVVKAPSPLNYNQRQLSTNDVHFEEDDHEEEDSEEEEEESEDERDYGQIISESMTNAMVQGAVLLKRSPIPDMMVSLTGYGLEGYKRVNTAFGVEEKIVHAGQKAVSAGITATGIFANAAIRAGLAYQMAPGRREKETAMQMLAIKEAEKAAAAAGNQPVKIVRVIADSLPGGIPPPQLVDAGTQTDWPIDQYIPTTLSTRSGKGGNSPQRGTLDASADPGDGTVRGVLASYLDSSLRVAGNVVTAGSEAVLGKERTLVLMGVDPIEARRIARQPAKQVKTDEKDDGLLPEDGNVVYVNVGGTLFATTLETLTTAYPDSLLAEWFGDEAKRASLELRDGCYFVDRDATHFRHIINYLRGLPSHLSLSRTPPALLELALEAEFYRLPDLASQLHDMYEDALLNPIAQLDDDQIEEKGWRDVAGLVRGVVGLAWRIGKGRLRRRRGVVVAVVNAAVVGVVLAALWVY